MSATSLYVMATEPDDMRVRSHVKVGISSNPEKRLKAVQTGCPHKVSLLGEWEFSSRQLAEGLERQFHREAAAFRSSGEWFLLSFVDANEILEKCGRRLNLWGAE